MPENKLNDWTIIKILAWTESYFKDHSIDSPRLTAEILLAWCLDLKRLDLYLQHDRPLQTNELNDFKALIKRRRQKEPVAYITGEKGFFDAEFEVSKSVLIPRPDTETIVEAALAVLNAKKNSPQFVLDLGTGSGAIVASLAKACADHFYFASDVSPAALAIARKNAEKIARGRVKFFAGAWLSAVNPVPRFNLIVSNPPYIPTEDIQGLQPEIRKFEPMLALDGGKDGLDCFRSILKDADHCLVPGGTLLLEMGFDQRQAMKTLFELHPGYASIDFIKDLAGHDRVAAIKKIN